MTASRKLAYEKPLKKIALQPKKINSSKSLQWYHWYQWISEWKKVDDESFLHDKAFVLKKKHFLQKQLYLL